MAILDNIKPRDLKGLRIYFDAGTEDRYGFGPPNRDLHERMKELGFDHTFEMVEGGGHAWGSPSMEERLVKSLRFVSAAFAKNAKSSGRADEASAKRRKRQ